MLTVLLIEPAPVLRDSLRLWLELDFAPCAVLTADDLPQALALATEHRPNAILLDLDALPMQDDLRQLRQANPQAALLGLGLDDTPSHRQRAEQDGVTVFIPKSQLQTDLGRVLRAEI
jgi:DNA-binding NarL/FixJ family response regulator